MGLIRDNTQKAILKNEQNMAISASWQEADQLVRYKLTQDYQKEQQLDLELKSSVLTICHMGFKKVNPSSSRQDFSNLHLRFSLTRCSDQFSCAQIAVSIKLNAGKNITEHFTGYNITSDI